MGTIHRVVTLVRERAETLEKSYQQLFPIFIEEDVLQCLLDVDAFLQVLQESVQVDYVLVDALEHLVEPSEDL